MKTDRSEENAVLYPCVAESQSELAQSSGGGPEVELIAALHQQDARMNPGSLFPYEDELYELFLCV
eukprot:384178-Amphidinium_carterae.1